MSSSNSVVAPGVALKKLALPFDGVLVTCVLMLLTIGTICMTSASTEIAEGNYRSEFFHLKRHLVYLFIGMLAALFTLSIPTRLYREMSWLALGIGFVLLIMVLVPGIGRDVNGSTRWIGLGGFNIQASEIAKLSMVIYTASYLVRHLDEVRARYSGFLRPVLVLGVFVFLLLLEPDFGAAVVMMSAFMAMMFLAGVKASHFFFSIVVCLLGGAAIAVSQPYRLARLQAFLDPWQDQFGSGYQLIQALIAIGRGDWFGVGLGNSMQKLYYLPEAHTDFVFAILAEELGTIGAIGVLILFAIFAWRALAIGRRAELCGHLFSAYMAYGLAIIFSMQAIINIGVNTGTLPTKGLTLPFLSYGGSSLVISCMAVAMLLRVDYEARKASTSPISERGQQGE
ncbi:putative lipid II flippase FtsW [Litoribrevibacter albus]|uniref:Probable peptidoglycan glycosyltransferase FtsW n=1 Tax=Litoribrevibacter albus TaxID=1473156 RepID=A0AA37W9D6_9GAMM|nr:putative lipid II flippase FtsW [Litoribrevibacter albus]GLQ33254.1 putative lipid II flippase FtsW [Litoribrevibacter albus]